MPVPYGSMTQGQFNTQRAYQYLINQLQQWLNMGQITQQEFNLIYTDLTSQQGQANIHNRIYQQYGETPVSDSMLANTASSMLGQALNAARAQVARLYSPQMPMANAYGQQFGYNQFAAQAPAPNLMGQSDSLLASVYGSQQGVAQAAGPSPAPNQNAAPVAQQKPSTYVGTAEPDPQQAKAALEKSLSKISMVDQSSFLPDIVVQADMTDELKAAHSATGRQTLINHYTYVSGSDTIESAEILLEKPFANREEMLTVAILNNPTLFDASKSFAHVVEWDQSFIFKGLSLSKGRELYQNCLQAYKKYSSNDAKNICLDILKTIGASGSIFQDVIGNLLLSLIQAVCSVNFIKLDLNRGTVQRLNPEDFQQVQAMFTSEKVFAEWKSDNTEYVKALNAVIKSSFVKMFRPNKKTSLIPDPELTNRDAKILIADPRVNVWLNGKCGPELLADLHELSTEDKTKIYSYLISQWPYLLRRKTVIHNLDLPVAIDRSSFMVNRISDAGVNSQVFDRIFQKSGTVELVDVRQMQEQSIHPLYLGEGYYKQLLVRRQ